MPSPTLELHAEAVAEAAAARLWYAQRSAQAAADFMADLDAAVARICETPGRYSEYALGTRKTLLVRFPFAVVYRQRGDLVQIVAVSHGSRRPGYWRNRLRD